MISKPTKRIVDTPKSMNTLGAILLAWPQCVKREKIYVFHHKVFFDLDIFLKILIVVYYKN